MGIRQKEHKRHLWLGNTELSAVAQHGWDTGHMIHFEETAILHKLSSWHERVNRESMEIYLTKGILNKEDGVGPSKSDLGTLS